MYRSDPDLREKVMEAYRDLAREYPDGLKTPRDPPPALPRATPRAPVLTALTVVFLTALPLAVTWRVVERRDTRGEPELSGSTDTSRDVAPSAVVPTEPRDLRPAATDGRPSAGPPPHHAEPPSPVPRRDSLLTEGLQLMRAGASDEACDRFGAAWRQMAGADRARVDATAIANAERECRRDFVAGAAMYERALQPVTLSP